MSDSDGVIARKLDLTARGLDLLSVTAQLAGSSTPLVRIPWEIGQWLGREKLTLHELEHCLQKAKGLIVANEDGYKLLHKVVRGVESKPVGPLFLRQSGSLGRLMANDPNLSWLISTVACLFQFHRDDRYITHTLTSFVIHSDALRHSNGDRVDSMNFMVHSPEHVQITPVVAKLVSSVWFNVVNAGYDTVPLPEELTSICSKGHYLDAEDFSLIARTLSFECKSKAILRADHLFRDLMIWLLLHYDGLLVVTLGSNIIYQKHFGNPARELEISVRSSCDDGESCNDTHSEPYEILQNIAGTFEHFLSGRSFSSSDIPPQPGIRQPLYEMPRRFHRDSHIYDEGVQVLIKTTAQSLTRWLLQVPVLPQQGFGELGFSVEPTKTTVDDVGKPTISDILQRVPGIINHSWGLVPQPPTVFVGSSEHMKQEIDKVKYKPRIDYCFDEERMAAVLNCFVPLKDAVRRMIHYCGCGYCKKENLQYYPMPQRGRLCRDVLEEIMLLVAHGIADGFGVNDVSSSSDQDRIFDGVSTVLYEFCCLHKVSWDSWFALASSVCLGCPFKRSPDQDSLAFGGTAYAAIQFGDLATVAPWLDLHHKFVVEGCFGLIAVKGRVGIITTSAHREEEEYQGVAGNFAIIETAGTEDTATFNSRNRKVSLPAGSPLTIERDATAVTSDVILISVDDVFYRLLMRIKTASHWRIVDPSDAMSGIIRKISIPGCGHSPRISGNVPHPLKTYDFDELLGRWPDTVKAYSRPRGAEVQKEPEVLHITSVLDSEVKRNVALALSVCSVAVEVDTASCCFSCVTKVAKEKERHPLRTGEGWSEVDRYIINVDSAIFERSSYPRSARKLIGLGQAREQDSGSSVQS
ncbi:MAG: hypothetical protein M1820_001936 [Bogoriella megaspora]|nr:MAG: hypothetical protein M1820_001936 [Bogoriella megaspora]